MKKYIKLIILLVLFSTNSAYSNPASLAKLAPWVDGLELCLRGIEAEALDLASRSSEGDLKVFVDILSYPLLNSEQIHIQSQIVIRYDIYSTGLKQIVRLLNAGCQFIIPSLNPTDRISSTATPVFRPDQKKDTIACGSEIDYEDKSVKEFIPIDGTNIYLNYSSKFNNKNLKNNSLNVDYNIPNQELNTLNYVITPHNSTAVKLPLILTSREFLYHFLSS